MAGGNIQEEHIRPVKTSLLNVSFPLPGSCSQRDGHVGVIYYLENINPTLPWWLTTF